MDSAGILKSLRCADSYREAVVTQQKIAGHKEFMVIIAVGSRLGVPPLSIPNIEVVGMNWEGKRVTEEFMVIIAVGSTSSLSEQRS